MYVNDIPKKTTNNPALLDYWITKEVKEKIKHDPRPQKKYTKLENFGSPLKKLNYLNKD